MKRYSLFVMCMSVSFSLLSMKKQMLVKKKTHKSKVQLKRQLSVDSLRKHIEQNKIVLKPLISKQNLKEGYSCAICLDSEKKVAGMTQLICGHSYHMGCILNNIHVNAQCPQCRKDINTDNLKIHVEKKRICKICEDSFFPGFYTASVISLVTVIHFFIMHY